MKRWPRVRMRSSPPIKPTIRFHCRMHCSPMASCVCALTPQGLSTLCAGAWRSPKTPATDRTNRTSRRPWLDSRLIRLPLAVFATFLNRRGRYEPAATVAAFAFSPPTEVWIPDIAGAIAHLRDVLGDQIYESLGREGAAMSTAAGRPAPTTRSTKSEPNSSIDRVEFCIMAVISRIQRPWCRSRGICR
jgi:hypothetical protein